MRNEIHIGVDPGVKTGVAIWDCFKKEFIAIETLKIHDAFEQIEYFNQYHDIKVFVEDARQRKWFGNNSNQKQQGAGSIKRDCKIWDDFLNDKEIDHVFIHPQKGMTKLNDDKFKKLTKWNRRTSEHSRDAAMIVFKN